MLIFLKKNFEFSQFSRKWKNIKKWSRAETLEEAKKINFSFSALGNVIHALTTNSDHIPYKDSKLIIRILQESLSGNFKTSLIVTCSPHSYHFDVHLSLLRELNILKIKLKLILN